MSDRFFPVFLCLLLAFIAAIPAAAQKTPQAAGPDAAPAAQEDQEPQPEPPRKVLNVEITNNMLSVELENVDFGTAIKAVAAKAGFKIEGKGEVFSRKLNTRFTDIEIERGVLRLLTLVKESNYMLHYDTGGMISKLEILGIDASRTPSVPTRQPMRPATVTRRPAASTDSPQPQRPVTVTPSPRTRIIPPAARRRPVISRPAAPSQPAGQLPDAAKPQAAEEDHEEDEPVDEMPYVAPQQRPVPGRTGKP
ncbi:MAG: hypothetical protein HZA15_07840 [Nitrospirae bacterium]|nr:hypothetical protein [Nitrospirota bacterium]